MSRLFASGPGDRGSIPGRVILKTQKMVLDSALLSTRNYKVKIKDKVEPSWEFRLGRKKSIFGARRGQTSSLQRGPHVVEVRWKSQHRKKLCVSLSLLRSKNLILKKVIKSFVSEPILSVFRDSLCIFHVFVFLNIFGRGYVTLALHLKTIPKSKF